MAIIKDPENTETTTMHAMVNFNNLNVLEVGCGEGRLTWRYADNAAKVTAIDQDGKAIEAARANLPGNLTGRVRFLEYSIEDFTKFYSDRDFDVAIFSWSL